MDKDTNKQNTLTEALSKIETLTADNGKLAGNIESANARIVELEAELSSEKTAHASAKESLASLESKHRNIDAEVASKVAKIAAESGVEPIKANHGGEQESIEDLAKRIDAAQGIEKAKLIEANADRISAHLKGGSK